MVSQQMQADAASGDVTQLRRSWMRVLARADQMELEAAWSTLKQKPAYECLRKPQMGLVMVRGRAGGVGAPFNLGEMTVTRCAVRLGDGLVGHAYVAGRSERRAELAAVFDALLQAPHLREKLEAEVILPLREQQESRRVLASRKAAATKVDFFALARKGGRQ
jgi:alpha-D-ribose 1-methylphosphonate 5-triphosphate synthase subunit PhnG